VLPSPLPVPSEEREVPVELGEDVGVDERGEDFDEIDEREEEKDVVVPVMLNF